jgi:hypothetical protein
MHELTQVDLKSFIKSEIIKKAKNLRGKHAPISEIVNNIAKSLPVEKIYDLSELNKYFYLLVVKNYSKQPKLRYYLAVMLANNSSDLLVQLASDIAIQHNLKLIQYSIFPKILRIQLLLLKEIEKIEDYTHLLKKLNDFRKEFRGKLVKVKKLIENE